MGVIHGKSVGTLKHLRAASAALAVYWCYVARANAEGVAWPGVRGLARDIGWDKETCLEGRKLLVELQALERVSDYVRPEWRTLAETQRRRNQALDKSEYYRVTGYLLVEGRKLPLLYNGGDEPSALEPMYGSTDVRPNRTSVREDERGTMYGSADVRPNRTELDSILQLNTNSFLEKEKKTGKKKLSAGKEQALLTAYADASNNVKKPFNGAADARALEAMGITPEDVRGCTEYLLTKDYGKENGVSWGEVCKAVVLWKQEKASQRGADYYLGQYADFIKH